MIENEICDRLPTMKGFIKSRIGNATMAEDIYGDAIIKIWKAIRNGGFKTGFSVSSYMNRCAQTAIYEYFRREGRGKRRDRADYEYIIPAYTPSHEKKFEITIENMEFMNHLGLKPCHRRILILSLLQQMKHHEIADTLGIPRATVSSVIARSRKKLGLHLNKARHDN